MMILSHLERLFIFRILPTFDANGIASFIEMARAHRTVAYLSTHGEYFSNLQTSRGMRIRKFF